MATLSQQELYDRFITALQSEAPDLTDTTEGSIIDILAGMCSTAVAEVTATNAANIKKTFFDTADGPEVTGGPDDLQTLAVDHFGSNFARPAAMLAVGTVHFSRPNTSFGTIVIPAGTIVKTAQSASGVSVRFQTLIDVTMSGISVEASVTALVAGSSGNVQAGKVTQIETTVADPTITVTNLADFSGGAEAQNDSQYRETIRNLIQSLKGATAPAIVAKALTVSGIVLATAQEFKQYVKNWDVASNAATGSYYAISIAKLFIADANGSASQALVDLVQTAIDSVRACGVKIDVVAATPVTINWNASISLNPLGPNYATLQASSAKVTDLMKEYLQNLDIGQSFDRGLARAFIMSQLGPSGTNDLTDFVTNKPVGNITAANFEKMVPGTITVS